MKSNNLFKVKIRLVISIIIAWLIISSMIIFHNHLFAKQMEVTGLENYDPGGSFLTNLFANLLAGIFAAPLLVFFLKDFYRGKPGWYTVFGGTAMFLLLVTLISMPVVLFYSVVLRGYSLSDPELYSQLLVFMSEPIYLIKLLSWTVISMLTIIALQVNDKYGHGVLFDLVRGKYNKPKEEQRIFMFLDMSSSTTIAEQLGNIAYFNLLRKFLEEISDPIINHHGEIYQFVGDEVVASWKLDKGIKNAQCLQCFFNIKKLFKEKASEYQSQFGLVPSFKAGFHSGKVTIGEIGTVKKDIIFSGDVLNTTARIQEACNRFDADLLVSEELIELLQPVKGIVFEEIGGIQLKGKTQPVTLFKASLEEDTNKFRQPKEEGKRQEA